MNNDTASSSSLSSKTPSLYTPDGFFTQYSKSAPSHSRIARTCFGRTGCHHDSYVFECFGTCFFGLLSSLEEGTKSDVSVVLEEEVWQRRVAVVHTFVRGWTVRTK